MRSANLPIRAPRRDASIVRHSDPNLKAFEAAFTAASTSALSPSWTSTIFCPVEGFTVGNVLPEADFFHSLLMKI